MSRPALLATAALLAALAFVHARLGAAERAGPTHLDLELATGAPATLYLPEPAGGAAASPPPGVVVVHGYAGDRAMMSTLARRLASNGMAALALDLRGHGASRERFPPGEASRGRVFELLDDVGAAVDWLRDDPRVDGFRLALVGHSMGSRTVLEYATRDSALDAVVAISGGAPLLGPFAPPNVLLLWAAGDPPRISGDMRGVATRLGASAPVELGRTFGDPTRGTAVRAVEIPGHDHISILWARAAAHETIAWLDAAFGAPPRTSSPDLSDPRPAWALAGLVLAVIALLPLGGALARLAPAGGGRPDAARGHALAVLLGLWAVTLPVAGSVPLAAFAGLAVVDRLLGHMAVAGAGAWILLGLASRDGAAAAARELVRTLPAAAAVGAVSLGLLAPLGVAAHRLAPVWPRVVPSVLLLLLAVPFFSAWELALRRGGAASAAAWSVLGRAGFVAILVLGIRAGAVESFVGFLVPILIALFVLFEVLAVAVHRRGGSPLAVAWVQAGWLAWLAGATLPWRG